MKTTHCAAFILILLFATTISPYLLRHGSAQDNFWKIPLSVSAGTTNISAGTPVITKLEPLAAAMPLIVDPFGGKTSEEGDDADWTAIYVFLEDARIQHQIDDVDGVPGFSSGDELVFQIPSTIAAGSAETFSLYFTTKEVGLPPPSYPLVNTVAPYPLKDYLNTVFEGPTIGESYVMQNGNVSAVVLVEGAWMSSCIYQLIINETGFDVVKQELDVTIQTETYKWTRFAMPADLGWLENNPNPTSGMFETLSITQGPVRCIVKMRSTASYNLQPGIYAVVTYTLYANQPWLDYKLEITGSGVSPGMTLDVNFVNREWGLAAGTIYDTVYVPGKGDLARSARTDVTKDEITEAWHIIYNKAQGKGFGMSFDMEGLEMIAWSRYTEGVAILYGNPRNRLAVDKWDGPTMDDIGMNPPFRARYFPIDSSIATTTPAEYMSTMYASWLAKPTVDVQPAEETTPPFSYIKVAVPAVTYGNQTERMNITGVTANCSSHGTIDDTNAIVADFSVYTSLGIPTGIEGNLTWTGSDWQALDVDLSSLLDGLYDVICYFRDEDAEGSSKTSFYIGNYIKVVVPTVTYDHLTERMNITGVTANCSSHGTIDDTNAIVADFSVYTSLGIPTGIEGNLTWTGSDWQALDVDLSSLSDDVYYDVICYFRDEDAEGSSKTSFYKFVDKGGPTIQDLSWSPQEPTNQDNVTVSVNVTDISGVKEVILSYNITSQWANTTTVKTQDTYAGVIPKASGGVKVHFKIYAQDNAGNWGESITYSYTVEMTTIQTNLIIGAILIVAILAAVVGFAYYTKRVHKREYKPVVQ